jgi:NitT/TauT family transport system substrate-binding protein
MDEITIGMVAPAIPCFPVWVAQHNGYFADHEVVATPLITGATDKVTSALRDNDCQIGIVTPEGVIADTAGGGTLRLVAGNTNKAPLTLIGLPTIHKIEDLRGKKIGTTSLQEGTAILVQRMLAAHGLRYPGDYEFALVGAHPERWDALQAGYSSLGAARDYVPHYAFTAIAVDLSWAQPQRDVAQRALLALREAVGWSRDNIDETAPIVAHETHGDLEHTTRALHDLFDDEITPVDLRVGPEALDEVIASTRQAGLVADGASLSYDGIVDATFTGALTSQ